MSKNFKPGDIVIISEVYVRFLYYKYGCWVEDSDRFDNIDRVKTIGLDARIHSFVDIEIE